MTTTKPAVPKLGRPPSDGLFEQLHLRLPTQVVDQLRKQAEREDRSITSLIRNILRRSVEDAA